MVQWFFQKYLVKIMKWKVRQYSYKEGKLKAEINRAKVAIDK